MTRGDLLHQNSLSCATTTHPAYVCNSPTHIHTWHQCTHTHTQTHTPYYNMITACIPSPGETLVFWYCPEEFHANNKEPLRTGTRWLLQHWLCNQPWHGYPKSYLSLGQAGTLLVAILYILLSPFPSQDYAPSFVAEGVASSTYQHLTPFPNQMLQHFTFIFWGQGSLLHCIIDVEFLLTLEHSLLSGQDKHSFFGRSYHLMNNYLH